MVASAPLGRDPPIDEVALRISGIARRAGTMSDRIREVEYRYVVVDDRPGEGTRVLGALEESGVNLLALLGFPIGEGKSQIDLVPEDPQALTAAAERAGLELSPSKKAILVQGEDRVGAADEHLGKLSQEGINVTAVAATAAGAGSYGMILWVKPDDHDRALQVLTS